MGVSGCSSVRVRGACACPACPRALGAPPPAPVLPPLASHDHCEPPPPGPHKKSSKMRVLKKIKEKMGLAGRGAPQQSSVPNNLPPLSFHRVRGDNVRLSRDAGLARRVDSFCKGVAFSARPVRVDERVCLRFAELSTNWSGVVRFGFTSRDPSSLHALPKYACPDLTGKPGYWAKALAERFCEKDAVLHYYVTQSGDCYFGIDGEDKGLFFSGVETRAPLWALVDVYGNCTALQFVDPRAAPPDAALRALRLDDAPPAPVQPRHPGPLAPLPLHAVRGRNVHWQESTGAAWLAPAQGEGGTQGGYVFTARPLPPESTLLLQVAAGGVGLTLGLTSCDPAVLRADELPADPDVLLDRREYWVVSGAACGGAVRGDELAVRLTRGGELRLARNAQPPRTALHVDHTLRLYAFLHIACPDTKIRILGTPTPSPPPPPPAASGAVASLVSGGARLRVELPLEASGAGGAPPSTVLVVNLPPAQNHANHALHAAAAACLSPHQQQPQPVPSVLAHHFLEALPPTASSSALPAAAASGAALPAPGGGECTVCYERGVDSVLYACGHMCMCYRCAVQQWRGKGGGHCPLCRAPIRDVIRTYKS